LGVIGQRLVRTLHPEIKLRIDLNHAPQTFAEVQPWLEPGQGKFVYAAAEDAGADEGYQGRCGIYELLNMSPALADLISASRPSSEISRKAIEDGMLDFRRASLIKVAQGATSFDEVLRVVPTADQWIGR
jgi:type II secretory ATPase GspE/PulE/Tfp pilus assembly ATPase PilB-like protein